MRIYVLHRAEKTSATYRAQRVALRHSGSWSVASLYPYDFEERDEISVTLEGDQALLDALLADDALTVLAAYDDITGDVQAQAALPEADVPSHAETDTFVDALFNIDAECSGCALLFRATDTENGWRVRVDSDGYYLELVVNGAAIQAQHVSVTVAPYAVLPVKIHAEGPIVRADVGGIRLYGKGSSIGAAVIASSAGSTISNLVARNRASEHYGYHVEG